VENWCPLPEKPKYPKDGLRPSFLFADKASIEKQVARLSAAINVPTISCDDNGDVEKDTRWKPFYQFHDVIDDLFPLVFVNSGPIVPLALTVCSHEKLELSVVNHLGLLFTWKGSDSKLKPILFAAHQDVVPAGSHAKWTHPPFEAHFDGKYIWGRGASDCKNNLIGVMSVAESLLSQNWKPKRTILFAFGFDEETGGERGAKRIALELEKRYGRHGIALVVNEGGMGVESYGDYVYALPAVAEKGYLDVYLTLEVIGGHSSRPPTHRQVKSPLVKAKLTASTAVLV
jgi:Gly-Xaa carboxypeptidase